MATQADRKEEGGKEMWTVAEAQVTKSPDGRHYVGCASDMALPPGAWPNIIDLIDDYGTTTHRFGLCGPVDNNPELGYLYSAHNGEITMRVYND